MIEIGKAIRILRTARGLRLNQLARAASISVPFLSLVENGARQPSLDVVRRVARALRVPSELLVLLGVVPSGRLLASDDAVNDLASSLRKLAEAENALRAKLEKEDARNAAEKTDTG